MKELFDIIKISNIERLNKILNWLDTKYIQTAVDTQNHTALQIALFFSDTNECVQILLDKGITFEQPYFKLAYEGEWVNILNVCHDLLNVKDNAGYTLLYYACAGDQLYVVEELIKRGAKLDDMQLDNDGSIIQLLLRKDHGKILDALLRNDPTLINQRNKNGESLLDLYKQRLFKVIKYESPLILHHFIANNDYDCVTRLFNLGISFHEVSSSGYSAIMYAAKAPNPLILKDLLNYIRQKKGDVTSLVNLTRSTSYKDCKLLKQEDGESALHLSCYYGREEQVDILISAGADIKMPTKGHGDTPLHRAAASGNKNIVYTLLKKLTLEDVNALDSDGDSALEWAVENGHIEIADCLIEYGLNVKIISDDGSNLIIHAARKGHIAMLKHLHKKYQLNINHSNKLKQTAIYLMIKNGYLQEAAELLDYYKLLSEKDRRIFCVHFTVEVGLYHAVLEAKELDQKQLEHQIINVYQKILALGASVNQQNKYGDTPLMIATQKNLQLVVQFLLENEAGINMRNYYGENALYLAFIYKRDSIIEKYIKHGVKLNKKRCGNGKNNLMTMLEYFIITGIDNPETISNMIEYGANYKIKNKSGYSLLHLAGEYGKIAILKYILTLPGIDINDIDNNGQTTLHVVCKSTKSLLTTELRTKIISILLEKGANPYITDHKFNTCIDIACVTNTIDVFVKTLPRQPKAMPYLEIFKGLHIALEYYKDSEITDGHCDEHFTFLLDYLVSKIIAVDVFALRTLPNYISMLGHKHLIKGKISYIKDDDNIDTYKTEGWHQSTYIALQVRRLFEALVLKMASEKIVNQHLFKELLICIEMLRVLFTFGDCVPPKISLVNRLINNKSSLNDLYEGLALSIYHKMKAMQSGDVYRLAAGWLKHGFYINFVRIKDDFIIKINNFGRGSNELFPNNYRFEHLRHQRLHNIDENKTTKDIIFIYPCILGKIHANHFNPVKYLINIFKASTLEYKADEENSPLALIYDFKGTLEHLLPCEQIYQSYPLQPSGHCVTYGYDDECKNQMTEDSIIILNRVPDLVPAERQNYERYLNIFQNAWLSANRRNDKICMLEEFYLKQHWFFSCNTTLISVSKNDVLVGNILPSDNLSLNDKKPQQQMINKLSEAVSEQLELIVKPSVFSISLYKDIIGELTAYEVKHYINNSHTSITSVQRRIILFYEIIRMGQRYQKINYAIGMTTLEYTNGIILLQEIDFRVGEKGIELKLSRLFERYQNLHKPLYVCFNIAENHYTTFVIFRTNEAKIKYRYIDPLHDNNGQLTALDSDMISSIQKAISKVWGAVDAVNIYYNKQQFYPQTPEIQLSHEVIDNYMCQLRNELVQCETIIQQIYTATYESPLLMIKLLKHIIRAIYDFLIDPIFNSYTIEYDLQTFLGFSRIFDKVFSNLNLHEYIQYANKLDSDLDFDFTDKFSEDVNLISKIKHMLNVLINIMSGNIQNLNFSDIEKSVNQFLAVVCRGELADPCEAVMKKIISEYIIPIIRKNPNDIHASKMLSHYYPLHIRQEILKTIFDERLKPMLLEDLNDCRTTHLNELKNYLAPHSKKDNIDKDHYYMLAKEYLKLSQDKPLTSLNLDLLSRYLYYACTEDNSNEIISLLKQNCASDLGLASSYWLALSYVLQKEYNAAVKILSNFLKDHKYYRNAMLECANIYQYWIVNEQMARYYLNKAGVCYAISVLDQEKKQGRAYSFVQRKLLGVPHNYESGIHNVFNTRFMLKFGPESDLSQMHDKIAVLKACPNKSQNGSLDSFDVEHCLRTHYGEVLNSILTRYSGDIKIEKTKLLSAREVDCLVDYEVKDDITDVLNQFLGANKLPSPKDAGYMRNCLFTVKQPQSSCSISDSITNNENIDEDTSMMNQKRK